MMPTIENKTSLPLEGIRVLELGHFIAAPFCTRLLADMGATVIKVEPPGKGDPVRSWGKKHNGSSAWWSVHGRNKQSVTLNLKHPKGRDIALDLVAEADIIVENNRPGQLERWGLGPAEMKKVNPCGILVRISGYGQDGPIKDNPAFGVIGEAIGGIRYLTDHAAGVADDLPPVRVGISIGDSLAGMYGALGALAALHQRNAGQVEEFKVIDVALSESVLSVMEGCLPEYGLLGAVRRPSGSALPSCAPTNAYPTSDGNFIIIAANSDPLFKQLAQAMSSHELAEDPLFMDNESRVRNVLKLDELIRKWTRNLTLDELEHILAKAQVPASRIYTIEDIAANEQYAFRKMVVEVDDPIHGMTLHPGAMPVFSGIDRNSALRWAGPTVGEHTETILSDLKYSKKDIEKLRVEGVV
ncbi:MAG: CoA transferase [Desulfuromonadales bacterium]|nr:CoA transferase [Desulfuromonadales bacterium]MBN2792535.1 CoA transferase [Desulfuromonadales bacterium]